MSGAEDEALLFHCERCHTSVTLNAGIPDGWEKVRRHTAGDDKDSHTNAEYLLCPRCVDYFGDWILNPARWPIPEPDPLLSCGLYKSESDQLLIPLKDEELDELARLAECLRNEPLPIARRLLRQWALFVNRAVNQLLGKSHGGTVSVQ